MTLVAKNSPADAGDIRDTGPIPGSGRSSGGGNGNPLQHSCLEKPMEGGAQRDTVHGLAKSWTRLEQLNVHMSTLLMNKDRSKRMFRKG